MTKQNIDPSSGQFIDPLFAIIIASALNETLILWVKSNSFPGALQMSVVVLGFINVLLSWYGYHQSVQSKPIQGVLRFSVTIILLPLYLLSIVLYSKPIIYVSIVYIVIFLTWSIWEWLRSLEYSTNRRLLPLILYKWNIIVGFALCIQFLNETEFSGYYPLFLKNNIDIITILLISFAIIYLRIVKSMSNDDSPSSRILFVLREWLINPASKESVSNEEKK
ncbi:MAG: hypothetical protein ACJA2S_005523 [Cyclobacteriaceae bacterium]|jgi:hypothetical protein